MYTKLHMNHKSHKIAQQNDCLNPIPIPASRRSANNTTRLQIGLGLQIVQQLSHKIAQRTTARINFQFPLVAAPQIICHMEIHTI